jgi:hypothetical protein
LWKRDKKYMDTKVSLKKQEKSDIMDRKKKERRYVYDN